MQRAMNRALRGLLVMTLAWVAGCDQPIDAPVVFDPKPTDVELVVGKNDARYEWHLSTSGYAVQKPPQMSFVNALPEKLSPGIDRQAAEFVPWSSEGVDPYFARFLEKGFQPLPTELDRRLTIKSDQLAGPQAFDVSTDGTRLITSDGKQLTMYNTETAARIGNFALPAEIVRSGPIEAVRFVGAEKDFLVAAPAGVFRINSRNGKVSANGPACGDPIKKWIVNDEATAMIVLTEAGNLLGGDPKLEDFAKYDLGRRTLDDVSLSPDGTRITVFVDGTPRVYTQDGFRIVDETDLGGLEGAGTVAMASGAHTEAWVDGDRVHYTYKDGRGGRGSDEFRMFWRPEQLLACSDNETWNWFLMVGHQFIDDAERIVLFDFGPDLRYNSIALPLDEMPKRMSAGRGGRSIALLDSKGLHLISREPWIVREPVLVYRSVATLVSTGKMSDIDRAIAMIRSQKRQAYGLTPEAFAGQVLGYTGYLWEYYDREDPDGELVKKLDEWAEQGSDAALVASAMRHYYATWFGRGRLFHVHVSPQFMPRGWRDQEPMRLAREQLAEALKRDNPPLIAYTTKIRIEAALEGLEAIDDLCLECAQRYPAEEGLFLAISGFLDSMWYGEPGAYLSFARPYSRMFDGPDGELMYALASASTLVTYHHQDEISWKSFDARRAVKGLDVFIARDKPVRWLLPLVFVLRHRDNNPAALDKALRFLISKWAAMPQFERVNIQHSGMELADKLEYDVPINWEAIDKIRGQ